MQFSIPRTELFLAQNVVNQKTERHYIRCVYIRKEGYITATDGRIVYVSRKVVDPTSDPENPKMLSLPEDVAFLPAKNKKPAAKAVRIDVDTDAKTMTCFDTNGAIMEIIPIEVVDGKRIDYKAFVAKHVPAENASASINPQLLKVLGQLESSSVNFTVGAEGTPSLIKAQEGMFLINPQAYTEVELPKLLTA